VMQSLEQNEIKCRFFFPKTATVSTGLGGSQLSQLSSDLRATSQTHDIAEGCVALS